MESQDKQCGIIIKQNVPSFHISLQKIMAMRKGKDEKRKENEKYEKFGKDEEQQSDNCHEENERTNYKYEANNRESL